MWEAIIEGGVTEADPFVVNDRSAMMTSSGSKSRSIQGPKRVETWITNRGCSTIPTNTSTHQTEVIGVLAGEYGVEFEGVEHRLSEGETVTVPAATPHRHWNPTSDPVRVAHEHHPAGESAAHAQALWTLGLRGKTDVTGVPNVVRFAVIRRTYPGIVYPTTVPIPVQKVVYAVLAPIGRLFGYQPSVPRVE